MEFTVVAKEVKLLATYKGIRIHQYLDDWLVRVRSPKQVLDFIDDQFDLKSGWVRPTPERWQNLQQKITDTSIDPNRLVQSGNSCP